MPQNLTNEKTTVVNTLRPRQNGRYFADDTFNRIFMKENVRISIKFSLKFVPKGPINNIPALVQIMAWRRPGDKPLSEPVMVSLLTDICVTRPQWVKVMAWCHQAYGVNRPYWVKSFVFLSSYLHIPSGGMVRRRTGPSTSTTGSPLEDNSSRVTIWGWDKMAPILQMTFSNSFAWMKNPIFKLYWLLLEIFDSPHCHQSWGRRLNAR